MGWSTAARVGLVVVLALGILAGAYVVLQGAGFWRKTYTKVVQFDNAQGLTKGTEVRYSGVRIGEVSDIFLAANKRANVRLEIEQKYSINPKDTITIATGGLLPTPYIEIIPARTGPLPPGGVLLGKSAVTTDELLRNFNALLPETQKLVRSLTSMSHSLESLVGDPRVARSLKNSAANLEAVTASGKTTAANLEVVSARGKTAADNLVRFSQQGNQIGTNFARTSRSLERTALLAEQAVRQNRGKIGETLDNLSGAMASLQDVLGEVKSALADETARTNLRETLAQMRQAMANLREASANLANATADVRNLTSDPKLNEDLRQTVASTRSTMEQADELVGRLNHLVGGKSSGASGARQQAVRSDFRTDVMHRSSLDRTSIDLDATLPRKGGFYRLGIHDFGEGSGLNLQLGNLFGSGRTSLRYGLHASRLGFGLDLGRPERPWLETDLYGLEETKLDVRGAYGFRRDLDLFLGVEELFRQNSPVIGLRWRPLRH
jgi:phospholipid/cholesterol/gamma-HCH transport system substrate-binding protein